MENVIFEQQADALIRTCSQLMMGELGRSLLTLSRGEFGVLMFLADRDGGVTSTTISDALGIGPGGVANVLKALEKKDLVKKDQDTRDRRANCVTITAKGRALLTERYDQIRASVAGLMEAMGGQACAELNERLAQLKEIARSMDGEDRNGIDL